MHGWVSGDCRDWEDRGALAGRGTETLFIVQNVLQVLCMDAVTIGLYGNKAQGHSCWNKLYPMQAIKSLLGF